MTFTTKRSLIALLMSLVLVVSIFTVSVFAETGSEETSSVAESVSSEAEESKTETESSSSSNSTSDADKEAEAERKEMRNTLIINGVIIACIIAVAVALVIRFHKKIFEFLRTVKSELKKIVWTSKENTRKSFIVVVIVAVAVALALFVIDYSFGFVVRTLSSLI